LLAIAEDVVPLGLPVVDGTGVAEPDDGMPELSELVPELCCAVDDGVLLLVRVDNVLDDGPLLDIVDPVVLAEELPDELSDDVLELLDCEPGVLLVELVLPPLEDGATPEVVLPDKLELVEFALAVDGPVVLLSPLPGKNVGWDNIDTSGVGVGILHPVPPGPITRL
jgi:hypothetical protein